MTQLLRKRTAKPAPRPASAGKRPRLTLWAWMAHGSLVLLLAACALPSQDSTSNAANTTDTGDFTVTSQPGSWKGHPQVEGYVHNKRDLLATRIILRVDALDGTGKVLSSEVRHLDRDIPPNDRVFYQVPAPGPAPGYRVRVDYVFWGGGGGGNGGGGG